MRKLIVVVALVATLAVLAASTAIGALVNGALPTSGFIYSSVVENSVTIAGSGISASDITALEAYIEHLAAISHPTATQQAALANYRARLADYQARYAAAIDLRAIQSTNVKTTYSRVPPSTSYEAGWHSHNGPVIVTVAVGTLTLYDILCRAIDVGAGQSYIESPRQVLNAKVLPLKNPGVDNVEWFTTRLYPAGAIDPVPAAAPCAP